MDEKTPENLAIDEQAAHWLRVMHDDPTLCDREAFWVWIRASRSHVRELLLAATLDLHLESFDRRRHIDIDALIRRMSNEDVHNNSLRWHGMRKPRALWLAAMAASVAIFVVATSVMQFVTSSETTYTTKLGEQRVLELQDGSVVFLNTTSQVRVKYSSEARDIFLERGQALFKVKHDAALPFRVHTASAVVQAIGTQFDVHVFDDSALVAVVEGTVQVFGSLSIDPSEPAPDAVSPPKVTAGEGATIDLEGRVRRISKINTATITGWSKQQLVFRNEPLSRITEEFNRYNVTPKLRVEGAALRERRFILIVNAHNPESLLGYLSKDPAVVFVNDGDSIVIREQKSITKDHR